VPILTQDTDSNVPIFNTTSNFHDQFIEPVWLFNENINMEISSFDCLEGPTNIVKTLSEITPFSVFKLLLSDEIITYIYFSH